MADDRIKVAFRLNGGIGALLVELNFVQFFYDKFSGNISITIYGSASEHVNNGLMKSQYFIEKYFIDGKFSINDYDLVIDLNWFPDVLHVNMPKIASTVPELWIAVKHWMDFKNNDATKHLVCRNDAIFGFNTYTYAIVNKKNRLDAMDLGEFLGIENRFHYTLAISKNPNEVLRKFRVNGNKYITIQNGINSKNLVMNSTKQWPLFNYTYLCQLIKRAYPDMLIIQLGEQKNSVPIQGTDICLLGNTDFEDLKILLKNAYLHIDGECGMVHMRRALQAGPSVVLFGPTPKEVYGHSEDINISTDACKGCAKLLNSWFRYCYLGSEPICMMSITPEMVFSSIKNYIETGNINTEVEKTVLQKLLEEPWLKLDEMWVNHWLRDHIIYRYYVETIRLKDLYGSKLNKLGFTYVPLAELPAYQFMSGDIQAYKDYMLLNEEVNPEHVHSIERCKQLVTSLEEKGFKQNNYIVINGKNEILDGAHRASWLLHKYGEDYEVNVLKLYGNWKI